jgi:hypothetical protein
MAQGKFQDDPDKQLDKFMFEQWLLPESQSIERQGGGGGGG